MMSLGSCLHLRQMYSSPVSHPPGIPGAPHDDGQVDGTLLRGQRLVEAGARPRFLKNGRIRLVRVAEKEGARAVHFHDPQLPPARDEIQL